MVRSILRRDRQVEGRLVEIGRIYKGQPKGTSTRSVKYKGGDDYNSPYLRFEPAERLLYVGATNPKFPNLHDELKAAWEDLIKEGRVRIRFFYPTIKENFAWSNKVVKEIGRTTKTFRECDGITCTRWTESAPHPTKPGETIPIFKRGEMTCAAIDGNECPLGCEAKGWIKFIVPDLYAGGLVFFPLNSPMDISNIEAELNPYKNLDLTAIPFSLFRKKDLVSYEVKGKSQDKDNWGIHLEPDPTMVRLMMQGSQQRYMQQLSVGNFAPVRSLPTAPTPALPAAPELRSLKGTDDGLLFEQRVHEAIIKGDRAELSLAVSDARDWVYSGLYDQSSLNWINSEEERAEEAISLADAAPKPEKRRINSLRRLTGHKGQDVIAIASSLFNRDLKASPMTGEEENQLVEVLLLDWATQKIANPLPKEDAYTLLCTAIATCKDDDDLSDESIFVEFSTMVMDAIAAQVEVEA